MSFNILPDTRASITIFPYSLIKETGTKINREKTQSYRLRNASKTIMNVEGEVLVYDTPKHWYYSSNLMSRFISLKWNVKKGPKQE